MATDRKHRLIEIDWPEFGQASPPPRPSAAEFQNRIDAARRAMEGQGLTHLLVYGDREHFANLAYLTGFDPRFEEALLVIGGHSHPLLIVGNECEAYVGHSPLYIDGKLRYERFQPFSLLNQPREDSRFLKDIFSSEEIGDGASVGCVGWKYFASSEHPSGALAVDLPAYLVDTLRELAGWANVVNATALLMHPEHGLRTSCSAAEIAYLEYTSVLASEGLKRMLFGIREGMTDHELARLVGYNGEPLACHMTLALGARSGLASPSGARVHRGDTLTSNLSYWGSNSCRAGWVASSARDLPENARHYVAAFAGPYFEVMADWYGLMRAGVPGADVSRLVSDRLPFGKFGIFLNAGHLIHLDEWVSSPIYPGSTVTMRSGMAMQADVIPDSPTYFSTRMEDGFIIADGALRQTLHDSFPQVFDRCQRRREFVTGVLGIDLPEEVLPLSNIHALVPPFLLEPNTVLALET